MKKLGLILFLAIVLFACKKKSDQPTILGIYDETFPFPGRTQLKFINSSQVVVTGDQITNSFNQPMDTADYQMRNGKMEIITRMSNKIDTRFFEFKLRETDSLELSICPFGSPCYASISEWVFKRK